ncbi:MAG: RNA polymerase sigma factor [Actinomycetota bacterium]|nr:RNA polymerase sigma factor [Actinomycetota bacterium]
MSIHAYSDGPTADDEAFAAMCLRYRRRLVAFCRARLHSGHDAEDAAHEVLLRAYRALPDYDHTGDAWPWLRTIAFRVCTDLNRRAARTTAAVEVPVADDVVDVVTQRMRADILDHAIGKLPSRYRTPLLLKEYAGWSYDDIARAQGKSVTAVRSTLSRSRRRLSNHVESVARSRGQWPLPGVVPPVRRLRDLLRSPRAALRSDHGPWGMTELSSLAARLFMGAQAGLAGLLGLTTAAMAAVLPFEVPTGVVRQALAATVEARPPSPPPQAPADPAPAPERAGSPSSSDDETQSSSHSEEGEFSGVDASEPVPEEYNPLDAGGKAGMEDYDETLWIGVETTIDLVVYQELRRTGTTFQCWTDAPRTTACTAVRGVFEELPDDE